MIEKPWAVFTFEYGVSNFGKVVKEDKKDEKIICLWIKYYEGKEIFGAYSENEPWDPNWVKTFDKSYKALSYFLSVKYPKIHNNKRVLEEFLIKFPSERLNIEKFLHKTNSLQ